MSKINISLDEEEILNLFRILEDKAIHYLKIKQFEKAHKTMSLAYKIEHQRMGINIH